MISYKIVALRFFSLILEVLDEHDDEQEIVRVVVPAIGPMLPVPFPFQVIPNPINQSINRLVEISSIYTVGTTILLTSMFPMMNGKKAKASPVSTIMGKAM